MRCIVALILALCFANQTICQIEDNFDDGNLDANPTWEGDVNHFIVNEDFQLQLMAPDEGNSFIYVPVTLADSMRWSAYCKMDFAPSGSNQLKIFLAANEPSVNASNSLYFEIGESGSEDALNLYESIDGNVTQIASGTMGALGSEPAEFTFTLEKESSGFASLNVQYGNAAIQNEWEMQLDSPVLESSVLFGFDCSYTASRADKFFFDNIVVEPLLPDADPPSVNGIDLTSTTEIDVFFSEPVNEADLANPSNYQLSGGAGSPTEVVYDSDNLLKSTLIWAQGIPSGTSLTLTIQNIADEAGNVMSTQSFDLQLVEPAAPGEVVVNEVLFNPTTGGFDYVEIYNTSDKFIDISSLTIANQSKNAFEEITVDGVLFPDDYLVVCEDITWLGENYDLKLPENVLEHDIPTFNDASGNVSVLSRNFDGELITIDSMDYVEEWHYILLDDEEGVSLERLSPTGESNNQDNWYSAASTAGHGTPGYVNSQLLPDSEAVGQFTLANKVFSPNGDGDGDQLIFNFDLDKPGYLATISVYNDRGAMIRELVDNILVAQTGILTWDGTKNDTQRASVGIYFIVYELFHPDGDTINGKLSCVLADFLE